jgi:hypothetical protein
MNSIFVLCNLKLLKLDTGFYITHLPYNCILYTNLFRTNCTAPSFDAPTSFGHVQRVRELDIHKECIT